MVGQRPLGRDASLQIVLAILLAAAAGAGPVGEPRRCVGARARRQRLGIVRAVAFAIRAGGRDFAAGRETPLGPIGWRPVIGGGGLPIRRLRLAFGFALARALEQRIALELALHIADEVE